MSLDPALTVPCPTCRVGAGQPCRSRHAIAVHQARRQGLADLATEADRMLAADRQKPVRRKAASPPVPVLAGTTGAGKVIPETAEWWLPWEHPPVPGCLAESGLPVTGLVWCAVHQDYEELRDGMPGVRLAGVSQKRVAR